MIDTFAGTRAGRVIRWPFRSPLAAPFWLAIRIYLGLIWLRFGWSKVEAGWIGGDGLTDLLSAIAAGSIASPLGIYQPVARLILETGMVPVLSTVIPIAEVTFGVLFISGLLLVPSAIGATLLNVNLILAGVAAVSFDARIIAIQLLIALGWRSAVELGLSDSVRRLADHYRASIRNLRHA